MERLVPVCCIQLGALLTTERRPAMTDRDRTNDASRANQQGDSSAGEDEQSTHGKEVMRGRSFAGANIANTEEEQTRERQRVADSAGVPLDEINEVTDAEIEARESNED